MALLDQVLEVKYGFCLDFVIKRKEFVGEE
jgi:hypothetical protein